TTLSRIGRSGVAPRRSSDRAAYPSMLARSYAGTPVRARTSSARTWPYASARSNSNGGNGRSRFSTPVRKSASGVSSGVKASVVCAVIASIRCGVPKFRADEVPQPTGERGTEVLATGRDLHDRLQVPQREAGVVARAPVDHAVHGYALGEQQRHRVG